MNGRTGHKLCEYEFGFLTASCPLVFRDMKSLPVGFGLKGAHPVQTSPMAFPSCADTRTLSPTVCCRYEVGFEEPHGMRPRWGNEKEGTVKFT